MDSEELIARYRLLPIWARLAFGAFLGIIPAYYTYLEDGDVLEEQLVQVEDRLGAVQRKFDREKKKRDKLPELEAKLAFTEQQLKESSKRLPDDFMMDDVLQETAAIAREVGVEMKVFDPGNTIDGTGAFKYMEMPISLELIGSFQQIAGFYDRIVNMEKMVHIRGLRLGIASDTESGNTEKIDTENMSDSQIQRIARNNIKLSSEGIMVIYRAMTVDEELKAVKPVKAKAVRRKATTTSNSKILSPIVLKSDPNRGKG